MANWIAYGLLCAVLVVAAVTDWRKGIVPNRLTVPAMIAGLLLAIITGMVESGWHGAATRGSYSIVALLAGFIPMALIFFAGGIGGGDVKLVAAVGAISGGWECVLSTCFYAFIVMAVMAMILMLRNRIFWRTIYRLIAAMVIVAMRSRPSFPEDSPKVPFALALCIGGFLGGAEHLLHLHLPWS